MLSKLCYKRSLRHFWKSCQFFLAILLIFVLYILILCHWMPIGLILLYFLLKYVLHHYEVITLTLNNAFALKFIFSKNIIDFNWYFFNTCLKYICIYIAFFDFQCFFVLIIGMFLLITYTYYNQAWLSNIPSLPSPLILSWHMYVRSFLSSTFLNLSFRRD